MSTLGNCGCGICVAPPNKTAWPKVFAISAGVFGIKELIKSVEGNNPWTLDATEPVNGLNAPPTPSNPCVATGTAPSAIAAALNSGILPNKYWPNDGVLEYNAAASAPGI